MLREPFQLGEWRVDPLGGGLSREGESRRLEPQVMRVLLALASRRGEVVSRGELLREVWGRTHVAEVALSRCVSQLRKALGDSRTAPRYVETLAKRGYRLVAPLAPDRRHPPAADPRRERRRPREASVALLALAAVGLALLASEAPSRAGAPAPEPAEPRPTRDATAWELYRRAEGFQRRMRREDDENAIALYERALERDPDFALARAGLASVLGRRGRALGPEWTARATEEARAALELEPGLAEAHKALGYALSSAGRLADAVEAYRRALRARPDYADAMNNLAVLTWLQGRWDEALHVFVAYARIRGHTPQTLANVAEMLGALGFREDAARWYALAVELEPLHPGAHSRLAMQELLWGQDPDRARARLERVLEVDPGCASCLVTLGDVELIAGDPAAAHAAFRRRVEIPVRSDYAELRVAQLTWTTDPPAAERRLESVVEKAEEAVSSGSERWRPPWHLAVAAAVRGRDDEAIGWLERSAELGRRYWLWDSLDPAFRALRDDPRFAGYVERMRLDVARMRRRVEESDVLTELRAAARDRAAAHAGTRSAED